MTDEELDALLTELEEGLRADVQAALALTAQDFTDALDGATELVAARFSVSGIGAMWRRRVGGIMDRLRGITGRAAQVAADDLGDELPDGWDDGLSGYVTATQVLLDAIGDRLAAEATQVLAEGLNAGEDVEQLKARLAAVFAADGTQLGESRAQRIAATEATRAWNAGTLAAAQALTGPDRPLVKQWLTRNDKRVRPTHREVNGQLQLLDDPFDVGGTPMQYPGDPTAPASETVQCRCILRAATAPERTASMGEVADTLKEMEAESIAAAADVHTGAMLALMPTEVDAARLALDGGETADQLHLTLHYLGEAVDWTAEQQGHLISRVSDAARLLTPIGGRAFGAAQWNPASDEPAWVWNVGNDHEAPGSNLEDAKFEVTWALEDGHDDPEMPQQHSPWSPHVCAVYSVDDWREQLAARVGPVTFDRVRVAFGGRYTDIPLTGGYMDEFVDLDAPEPVPEAVVEQPPQLLTWSTPPGIALAFENQQTGDGRVFAPGSLYWEGSQWPLQYADEMNGGHEGARLAGAIFSMGRDEARLTGDGVLYLTQEAGAESAMLLAQGAPLGVSVDLDDVSMQLIDATGGEGYDLAASGFTAHLATASVLPLPDGGWRLTGETAQHFTASGTGTVGESSRVDIVVGSDGRVPAAAFEITAAAGDSGDIGVVVEEQRSGDYLMRITRARVRGATLVTIPAYANATIVLDPSPWLAASATGLTAAAAGSNGYDVVTRKVRKSLTPMTAGQVAKSTGIPIVDVRRYLARGVKKGAVARIAHGRYINPEAKQPSDYKKYGSDMKISHASDVAAAATAVADEGDTLTASATGSVSLPVAPRDTTWDGDGAESRVFAWADGDTSKLSQAFAYRNDEADPTTQAAYKLGYADMVDGTLTIIPKGVFAAEAAVNGARGGVDIPSNEVDEVKAKLAAVRAHVDEETGGDQADEMQASAWAAMKDLPAMPAAWFAAPTDAELPPGGPGVNYKDGRVFGWVAQSGEPHAGYAKKVTIDTLGRIDTTHFLRQRFTLDDGSVVKAGAFTMNAGHHRDGAECETASCQFDDTRTVAGIVTVGMSDRGMWFSGAAAPWMSDWDRNVFAASQPSYHMKKGPNGNWQLRAVLSVPVPGHSSPLLASAVVDRSNMALTAAATMLEVEEAVAAATAVAPDETETVAPAAPDVAGIDYARLADEIVAASARAEDRKAAEAAELEALLAEGRKIVGDTGTASGTEGN